MTQQVKGSCLPSESLALIPKSYIMEGENQLWQIVLQLSHESHGTLMPHYHTINK